MRKKSAVNMRKMVVCVLRQDNTFEFRRIPREFSALQFEVDGDIEFYKLTDDMSFVLNADAGLEGRYVNRIATRIIKSAKELRGPVLIVAYAKAIVQSLTKAQQEHLRGVFVNKMNVEEYKDVI